jgi:hypothetical protein
MLERLLEICATSQDCAQFKHETRLLDKRKVAELANTINTSKNTNCLLLASLSANLGLVKYLIEACGVDKEQLVAVPNELENWDQLTFYKAETDSVYSFLNDEYAAVYNLKGTVLWHLCRSASPNNNQIQIIKYLIKKGADANSKLEPIFNSTPLMYSFIETQINCCPKCLIDLNLFNLRIACMRNELNLVKFLIEIVGVNLNEVDKASDTCLFYAGD